MFSKNERVRIRLLVDAASGAFECTVTAVREHGRHTWVEVAYVSGGKPCVGAIPLASILFVQRLGFDDATAR